MAKETKDCHVKVRITPTERKAIEEYCEQHDLKISEFMRIAFTRVLGGLK